MGLNHLPVSVTNFVKKICTYFLYFSIADLKRQSFWFLLIKALNIWKYLQNCSWILAKVGNTVLPFFPEKGEKRVNIQMRTMVIGIGFPWFLRLANSRLLGPKIFHRSSLYYLASGCCYCMPNRLAFSIQTQRRAKRTPRRLRQFSSFVLSNLTFPPLKQIRGFEILNEWEKILLKVWFWNSNFIRDIVKQRFLSWIAICQ